MKITKSQLKRVIKEELAVVLAEVAPAAGAVSIGEWLAEEGAEMVEEELASRLQETAQKLLENPNVVGGRWAASITNMAAGALTVYGLWQAYQDMSEILADPDVAAEWNDDIARALSSAGHGLAKHGAPSDPKYWGVKSCDQLHGYALKTQCARWEKQQGVATSSRAAERHGGERWKGRIFPPRPGSRGFRTWNELAPSEKRNPKNYEKWIAWRKKSGKQR